MEGFSKLLEGFIVFRWEFLVMYAIGGVLISLAIKKDYEPMLLLPIGFGAILVNLPLNVIWGSAAEPGALLLLYNSGILTELFPLLIFVGIGAMTDFRPLFSTPRMIFFGAAFPQLGFDLLTSASIGIIGAADGPTSGSLTVPQKKSTKSPDRALFFCQILHCYIA